MDTKARRLRTMVVRTPWELNKVAYTVHSLKLWKYMSTTYDKIESWFVDIKVSRSTGMRGVRLYGNCHKYIPDHELFKISLEGAEWILKLPEKDRSNPDIWKKAQTMKEDDFMEFVNERRRANGETPEDGRVTMKLRCYSGQADVIKSAYERFAEANNLGDDYGRALELICADYLAQAKDGKSFMAKLGERITGAAFELSQLKSTAENMRAAFNSKDNKSGDEILLAVASELDALEAGILKSVEALAAATKNMASKQPKGQQSLSAPPLEAAKAAAAAGTSSKVN